MNEPDYKIINCGGRSYRAKIPPKGSKLNLGHFIQNESKKQNFDLSITQNVCENSFTTTMEVAPMFLPFIIGKKGATKRKLENETGASIIIPDRKDTTGKDVDKYEPIVINAPSQEAILDLKTRLEILFESATKSLPYTHFISIPLNIDPILENAQQFKKDLTLVSQNKAILGFEPSLISKPEQLHITIAMLKLFNTSQIEHLKSVMTEKWAPKIYDLLQTRSLMVKIQELSIMNSDPNDAHIVHLNVKPQKEGDDRLNKLCNFIISELKKENLLDEEQDKEVKIHVTLINSKFRNKEQENIQQSNNNNRQSFDAKGILATYGKIDFGVAHLKEIIFLKEENTMKMDIIIVFKKSISLNI